MCSTSIMEYFHFATKFIEATTDWKPGWRYIEKLLQRTLYTFAVHLLSVSDGVELSVPAPPRYLRVWHAANVTRERYTFSYFTSLIINRNYYDRGA